MISQNIYDALTYYINTYCNLLSMLVLNVNFLTDFMFDEVMLQVTITKGIYCYCIRKT